MEASQMKTAFCLSKLRAASQKVICLEFHAPITRRRAYKNCRYSKEKYNVENMLGTGQLQPWANSNILGTGQLQP